HLVVRHLDEAAVDGDLRLLAAGLLDRHRADAERADERRVAGEEGDVALARAGHDHLRLAGPQDPLGRHQVDLQGHSPCSCLALARAASAPPTLRNACSGKSSRSPVHSRSKDSNVSSTGVVTPGRPVNTSATYIGCDRKRWILRARLTVTRSSSDSSSRPRMAMMSCSSL